MNDEGEIFIPVRPGGMFDPARAAAEPARAADMLDPLPVTGYTPQPTMRIEAVNRSKDLENRLGDFVESLRTSSLDVDPEWTAEAVRLFQHGFMALNRAVFQPESRLR